MEMQRDIVLRWRAGNERGERARERQRGRERDKEKEQEKDKEKETLKEGGRERGRRTWQTLSEYVRLPAKCSVNNIAHKLELSAPLQCLRRHSQPQGWLPPFATL